MVQENIVLRRLAAEDGMMLTNGEIFAKEAYLGALDSPENWREVTEAEAEAMQSALAAEAAESEAVDA